jgi:DnaK suppressor protein
MDKESVEELRKRLETRKLELEEGIVKLKNYLTEEHEDLAEEEERARVEEDRTEKEAKLDSLLKEQDHIGHTLKKVLEGKFGICEKCHGEIDKLRLELVPTACLCMNCKEICESCGVAIEEHLTSGKPLPAKCQNCEEEFESETTFTSSSINPHK